METNIWQKEKHSATQFTVGLITSSIYYKQ